MEPSLRRFLGDGPYPLPVEDFLKVVEIFPSSSMIVVVPKTDLSFMEGQHDHESYEFLIPFTKMPIVKIEGKKMALEKHKLLPINSFQSHGPAGQSWNCRFLAFQIEKEFIDGICRSVYKKPSVVFENGIYPISGEVNAILSRFIEESRNKQAGYQYILESLSTQVVVSLIRSIRNNMSELQGKKYYEKNNINRALEFISENYNNDFSLGDVAGAANLSPYHFIRVFKASTGVTPHEYLLKLKIEKACEMLKTKTETITSICFLCGFKNLSHFITVFKRFTGVTPTQYRANFNN